MFGVTVRLFASGVPSTGGKKQPPCAQTCDKKISCLWPRCLKRDINSEAVPLASSLHFCKINDSGFCNGQWLPRLTACRYANKEREMFRDDGLDQGCRTYGTRHSLLSSFFVLIYLFCPTTVSVLKNVCVCVCVCVWTYVYTHTHTHTHTQTYLNAYRLYMKYLCYQIIIRVKHFYTNRERFGVLTGYLWERCRRGGD